SRCAGISSYRLKVPMANSLPAVANFVDFKSSPKAQPSLAERAGRVAIVHDWCPDFRGGERVLSELCRVTGSTEIFTLFDFLKAEEKQDHFPGVEFHASALNTLPLVRKYYRSLFFACPFLIEQIDVTSYDMVITSSAAFARGVLTRPDQPHICYVHSP